MSKLIIFFFLLSLPSWSAEQNPYLISGFDDVLRQAENTGLIKAALKIFENDKTFAGMAELYQVLTRSESGLEKFILVSAISNVFDARIDKLLSESHYPTHKRYLRSWLTEWSIENFKISKIKKIIDDHPDRKFMVIFDNSQASIRMARTFQEKFSDKIVNIYLRKVVAQDPMPGVVLFTNAFEIALNEYKQGRLSPEDLANVGNSLLSEKIKENIFPSYALCPKEKSMCLDAPERVRQICHTVEEHLQKICLN